ncbi:MAG: Flp family type IVb pilin [Hyphomonadaceae bacterium]|nr:Flp family type IVb pilin [Hyphomonadaceae bacterium]
MSKHFCRDRRGTTAIEYAIIASLIAVALFAAIFPIGGSISDIFDSARGGMEGN